MGKEVKKRPVVQEDELSASQQFIDDLKELRENIIEALAKPENEEERKGLEKLLSKITDTENTIQKVKEEPAREIQQQTPLRSTPEHRGKFVVVSDQTIKAAPILKIELEQKPQESNPNEGIQRKDQPDSKALDMPEQDQKPDLSEPPQQEQPNQSPNYSADSIIRDLGHHQERIRDILNPVKDVAMLYYIWKSDQKKGELAPHISNHLKTLFPDQITGNTPSFCVKSTRNPAEGEEKGKKYHYLEIRWQSSEERRRPALSLGRLEGILYELSKQKGASETRISDYLKELYLDVIPPNATAQFATHQKENEDYLCVEWQTSENAKGHIEIDKLATLLESIKNPTLKKSWANQRESIGIR